MTTLRSSDPNFQNFRIEKYTPKECQDSVSLMKEYHRLATYFDRTEMVIDSRYGLLKRVHVKGSTFFDHEAIYFIYDQYDTLLAMCSRSICNPDHDLYAISGLLTLPKFRNNGIGTCLAQVVADDSSEIRLTSRIYSRNDIMIHIMRKITKVDA